jgi:hypothetical protein
MGISRDMAIELVEEGLIDPIEMVKSCVKYMSEDDVADMLKVNEYEYGDLHPSDYGDGPDWAKEWEDFGECYE